jgi:hypothetical protein
VKIFNTQPQNNNKNKYKLNVIHYGSPFLTSIMWMKRGMILLCSSWMKKWDNVVMLIMDEKWDGILGWGERKG